MASTKQEAPFPKKISELNFATENPSQGAKAQKARNLQGREPNQIIGEITQLNREAVESLESPLERFREETLERNSPF